MSEFGSIGSILLAVVAVLAVTGLFIAGAGLWAFRRMCRQKPKKPGLIAARLEAKDALPAEILSLGWEEARVASPHGYELSVHWLQGARPRLAVFHHGISWNWLGTLRYMKPFIEAGWSVAAFDARAHGESGGRHGTFGVFERHDLGKVADAALSRFPGAQGLVLHGVSLGAAVSLQFAGEDRRPAAVIADAPFTTAAEEMDWHLERVLGPGSGRKAVLAVADFLCRKLDGFSLRQADSRAGAEASDADILFIHGMADTLVPPGMSEGMAKARRVAKRGAVTEFAGFDGAGHGKSRASDPERYDRLALSFAEAAVERRLRAADPGAAGGIAGAGDARPVPVGPGGPAPANAADGSPRGGDVTKEIG